MYMYMYIYREVLEGPRHSVLGDRTVELGKPYREAHARTPHQW